MQVASTSAITNSSAAATETSATPPKSLDYDAFLKLLVAQLKYQDPTKPMDPAQQMAQLASFSNVEQAIKTNAKLDALISSFSLTQAESVIGRTVASQDGSITGLVKSVRVTSEGAVAILDNGKELLLGPGVTIA